MASNVFVFQKVQSMIRLVNGWVGVVQGCYFLSVALHASFFKFSRMNSRILFSTKATKTSKIMHSAVLILTEMQR